MKKIRTASVRATTAEIEAEQNEKRQRNNSPRLTIVKIVLTHQTESNFTFKNAVCEQYNIENTTDDRDVFEMYAKNFYKILDKDEFIVPDKGKKKGISVKLAKSGLVKHNDQITLTPEEAANKLEVHSSKNILEGIVIGGIYGRPRNARQLKNRNKKKDVNRDDVITDDYYVMIYLPMDNNIGFLLLQYYPDITIKDEITKFKKRNYFRVLKFASLVIAIILTVFVSTGINKDFAGYIISALSIFIGLNISLIIMLFDKFNSTNFDTNNKTYKDKVKLLKHRNFFMQFTSLTAYSIILSLVLIVLLSICFSQHFTSSISISEKIAYVWEMMKTDWTPGWSWKIFMFALWQATILVIRCFTYYLLFYFIIILFYSVGSAYAYISQEYENKKIELYKDRKF